MRARIEGLAVGDAYIDVDEIDGQPPPEVIVQSQVTIQWGSTVPEQLTIPLASVEAGVAVYKFS